MSSVCLMLIFLIWNDDFRFYAEAGLRFSLGEYQPSLDQLLPTGEVRCSPVREKSPWDVPLLEVDGINGDRIRWVITPIYYSFVSRLYITIYSLICCENFFPIGSSAPVKWSVTGRLNL